MRIRQLLRPRISRQPPSVSLALDRSLLLGRSERLEFGWLGGGGGVAY